MTDRRKLFLACGARHLPRHHRGGIWSGRSCSTRRRH